MENPSYDVGCSLKLRLGEEGHIASTPAELRTMSRAVLSQGRAVELLAFRCEANQLRVVAACDEARAHKLDRRLKIQLRRLLHPNVRFGHTWIDVHNDVFKLSRAFKSVVRRSGWAERKDPFDEGSNLLDLLGLRICGGYTIATVKTKLPDIQREFLLSRIGFTDLGAERLPQAWHTLGEATLSVVAALDLQKRSIELAEAKHAAVRVVAPVLRTEAIGALLRLKPRTVRALRADEKVNPRLCRAIVLQLQLRAARLAAPPCR